MNGTKKIYILSIAFIDKQINFLQNKLKYLSQIKIY